MKTTIKAAILITAAIMIAQAIAAVCQQLAEQAAR